ncbi:MBL fold metallo-hydrolase [Pedobacter sp. HDW13]|uniref:MBL fold metallo-hydrolase n=1 Tax=Pedobacter sp. HDW13 TaxID=2714940 RepID=UPI00140B0292|nr:MBL fold metallo-hydrolase [Pedobacter sp. HDW13]QIL40614.1 MBL fold metallo-hydrolase [Pedobacter sp. HDW13]
MTLIIRILQTKCGDAIIIKHGQKPVQNIVVDSGYMDTYITALKSQMKKFDKPNENFKLWILTHLDADHINGAVAFFRDKKFAPKRMPEELWFNCFDNFRIQEKSEEKSVDKGIEIRDFLKGSKTVLDNQILTGKNWTNQGLAIEVIAPGKAQYDLLGEKWEKEEAEYQKKKLGRLKAVENNDYENSIENLSSKRDRKESKNDINNLSSIAFILNFNGSKILFLGDATPNAIKQGLQVYLKESKEKKLKCDYVKLPHHGSIYNYSESLYGLIECSQFIICSNGDNSNKLPNKETLAKILCHPSRDKDKKINFIFNYNNSTLRSIFAVDKNARKKYNFKCSFPKGAQKYYDIKF